MSGFWAGAVPPWALAAGACLWILAVLIGAWYGYGRGWKHAEEETRWAREQAKARRTHPVYRQPTDVGEAIDPWAQAGAATGPQRSTDRSLRVGTPLALAHPPAAITTGEIQAITDEIDMWMTRQAEETDDWLAEHVYSAPTDYGAWLEQEDGHA